MPAPVDGPLVEASGLRKEFGSFVAVDGVDFEVRRGEVFGFLGPNGAGKSSTMRMIGTTSPRSGGELRVLGLDPEADGRLIRSRLGVVPQDDTLDTELTVEENLMIYGRYFGISRREMRGRIEELLDFAQLGERRHDRVDPLSGGMKRRLTIARSLVNRPELVILDEPTTGLDPQARHVLWDRMHRLRAEGTTLLLTTHYMDEAEQLCDRLVIMDHGRIAAEGSPSELIAAHASPEVVEFRLRPDDLEPARALAERLGDRVEVLTERLLVGTADGVGLVGSLGDAGIEPLSSFVRRSTLEDVFLVLTGRTLVD